jgi:hypothetical protein
MVVIVGAGALYEALMRRERTVPLSPGKTTVNTGP